jgi:hypothetical protein
MSKNKQAIVTFKADESLLEVLRSLPNRSAFIRSAVLQALDHLCPLCQGTGILTPPQKEHWEEFAADHSMEECTECHEWRLVCAHEPEATRQQHTRPE